MAADTQEKDVAVDIRKGLISGLEVINMELASLSRSRELELRKRRKIVPGSRGSREPKAARYKPSQKLQPMRERAEPAAEAVAEKLRELSG